MNERITADLAQLLRTTRVGRHLTLHDIAVRMDTTPVYVSNIELGKKVPVGDNAIQAISKAYELPFDQVRRASWLSRSTFELEASSDEQKELAIMLTRQFSDLSNDTIARLRQVLDERERA